MTNLTPRPSFNQADKVLAALGGYIKVAEVLGVARSTTIRWTLPHPKGSDGLIPTAMVSRLQDLADSLGITLDAQTWLPERRQS